MIRLEFERPVNSVLCLAAHPDDIEIGAFGLINRIATNHPDADFVFLIAANDAGRAAEAQASATDMLGNRVRVEFGGLTDNMLPYRHATDVKEFFRREIGSERFDIVVAPHRFDRHQDHQLVAEMAHQLCRNQPILEFEIPKLEGDLSQPSVYVPMTAAEAQAKVDHLAKHFASQQDKPWYNGETFEAVMRLRGLESLAPDGHAEAFHTTRLVLA